MPFIVYLVALAGIAVAVVRTPESRRSGIVPLRDLGIRPRVGVAGDRLGAFAAPAITGFVIFSLAGLYFALIPTVLSRDLHQRNAAVAGVIVAELALVAMAAIAVSHRAKPDSAMRAGLIILLPAVGLVVAAQAAESMLVLVLATALAGLAIGLGYFGSLQVVNDLAPDEHRGAVASSYFLACFVGNSVPVIGVGVISTIATPLSATVVLACTIAALSAGTLAWSWPHRLTA